LAPCKGREARDYFPPPSKGNSIERQKSTHYRERNSEISAGPGAIWVALRVPDGMIAAHANKLAGRQGRILRGVLHLARAVGSGRAASTRLAGRGLAAAAHRHKADARPASTPIPGSDP